MPTETRQNRGGAGQATGTVAAVAIGVVGAFQARVNGTLSEISGSPLVVTLLGFCITTVILVIVLSARGPTDVLATVRRTPWRRWWLLSGPCGAVFVLAISFGVPLVGVTLATALTVTGQILAGLILDASGIGTARRTPVTPMRATAGFVAVVGLAVAAKSIPELPSIGRLQALGIVAALVCAGICSSVQQAVNGVVASTTGDVRLAASFSALGGSAVLAVIFAGLTLSGRISGPDLPPFSTSWWLYTGGLMGAIFMLTASWAVRICGVLTLGLAVTGGQMVCALGIDAVNPGTDIGLGTLLSVVLVALAVICSAVSSPATTLKQRADP